MCCSCQSAELEAASAKLSSPVAAVRAKTPYALSLTSPRSCVPLQASVMHPIPCGSTSVLFINPARASGVRIRWAFHQLPAWVAVSSSELSFSTTLAETRALIVCPVCQRRS